MSACRRCEQRPAESGYATCEECTSLVALETAMAEPDQVDHLDQPEFRVGGKQPGNLYRNDERFGFVLRDEDGPLVAAALNAYVDAPAEPVRADRTGDQPVDDRYVPSGGRSAYVARLREDHVWVPGDGCRCGKPLCPQRILLDHVDDLIKAYELKVADFANETARATSLLGERDSARAEVDRLQRALDNADKGLREFSELSGRHLGYVKRLVKAALGSWDAGASEQGQVETALAFIPHGGHVWPGVDGCPFCPTAGDVAGVPSGGGTDA